MTAQDMELRQTIRGSGRSGLRRRPPRRRWRSWRLPSGVLTAATLGGAVAVGAFAFWPQTASDNVVRGPGEVVAIDPEAARADTLVRREAPRALPSPLENPGGGRLAAASPSVPPPPVPAAPLQGRLDAGALVASANPVYAALLERASVPYAALGWEAPGDWADGACRARAQPRGIAYCNLDGTIYAPSELPRDARVLLSLAREIGRHMQAQMGLMLEPLSKTESALQADCFAGLWAGNAREAGDWLYPERLESRLDPAGLDPVMAERLAAFRQGYLGTGPGDCRRVRRAEP